MRCGSKAVIVLKTSPATTYPVEPTAYRPDYPRRWRQHVLAGTLHHITTQNNTIQSKMHSVTCCSCLLWNKGHLRHNNHNPVPLTTIRRDNSVKLLTIGRPGFSSETCHSIFLVTIESSLNLFPRMPEPITPRPL